MRNRFDRQLAELNNKLTEMGALCENAIEAAIKAFLESEPNYAKEAILIENEIDELEQEIEQSCLRLLLQQQPVAKDLRLISSALKMITDLERIGDQAQDIAELSKYTKDEEYSSAPAIKEMAKEAVKMVKLAIDSFVKADEELAISVVENDDVVDALFSKVKGDIIELIRKETGDAEGMVDLLMIAKYLERIADHATNIAEWVVFSVTGRLRGEKNWFVF